MVTVVFFLVGLFVVRGDIVDVDGKNAGYDGKECLEHVCVWLFDCFASWEASVY